MELILTICPTSFLSSGRSFMSFTASLVTMQRPKIFVSIICSISAVLLSSRIKPFVMTFALLILKTQIWDQYRDMWKDMSISNIQQIYSIIFLGNPSEQSFDLWLICDVTLQWHELSSNTKHRCFELLKCSCTCLVFIQCVFKIMNFHPLGIVFFKGMKAQNVLCNNKFTSNRGISFNLAKAQTVIPLSTRSLQIATPTDDEAPKQYFSFIT